MIIKIEIEAKLQFGIRNHIAIYKTNIEIQ